MYFSVCFLVPQSTGEAWRVMKESKTETFMCFLAPRPAGEPRHGAAVARGLASRAGRDVTARSRDNQRDHHAATAAAGAARLREREPGDQGVELGHLLLLQ